MRMLTQEELDFVSGAGRKGCGPRRRHWRRCNRGGSSSYSYSYSSSSSSSFSYSSATSSSSSSSVSISSSSSG